MTTVRQQTNQRDSFSSLVAEADALLFKLSSNTSSRTRGAGLADVTSRPTSPDKRAIVKVRVCTTPLMCVFGGCRLLQDVCLLFVPLFSFASQVLEESLNCCVTVDAHLCRSLAVYLVCLLSSRKKLQLTRTMLQGSCSWTGIVNSWKCSAVIKQGSVSRRAEIPILFC